ncbi:MAG: hypothetical protein ACJ8GN_22625 [Longimicrobiaceae bacterium]
MEASAEQLAQNASRLIRLISFSVAGLIPLVFPAALIPSQLASLAAASSLLGMLAFLAAINFGTIAQRHCRRFTLAAVAFGLATIALNQALVVTLDVGEPPRETSYLTGWSLSAEGASMLRAAGVEDEVSAAQVARIGADQIPRLFGGSYQAARVIYSLALLLLVFCSIFAIVGTSSAPVRERAPVIGPPV